MLVAVIAGFYFETWGIAVLFGSGERKYCKGSSGLVGLLLFLCASDC